MCPEWVESQDSQIFREGKGKILENTQRTNHEVVELQAHHYYVQLYEVQFTISVFQFLLIPGPEWRQVGMQS